MIVLDPLFPQRCFSTCAFSLQALQDAMAKQQKQLKERLDARRTAQEAAEYEEEMAIALVRNAEREHSFVLEKKHKERNRQQDLVSLPLFITNSEEPNELKVYLNVYIQQNH